MQKWKSKPDINGITNDLVDLISQADWVRYFCTIDNRVSQYIRDPPVVVDAATATCICQSAALQIIQLCLITLCNGFLTPWLLSNATEASFKLILSDDIVTGVRINNDSDEMQTTSMAKITLVKSCQTISGFYVSSIQPVFDDNNYTAIV